MTFGPLRGHLGAWIRAWASVLAGKDYIFPFDWGSTFWIVNFGYLAVARRDLRMRRVAVGVPRERGWARAARSRWRLCSWCLADDERRLALALQLQTSRVFWMLDLFATIYLAWLLADRAAGGEAGAIVVRCDRHHVRPRRLRHAR